MEFFSVVVLRTTRLDHTCPGSKLVHFSLHPEPFLSLTPENMLYPTKSAQVQVESERVTCPDCTDLCRVGASWRTPDSNAMCNSSNEIDIFPYAVVPGSPISREQCPAIIFASSRRDGVTQ